MKINAHYLNKLFFYSCFGLLCLTACSEKADLQPTNAAGPAAAKEQKIESDQFLPAAPSKTATAQQVSGGLCPVDSINKQMVASPVAISKKNPIGFDGWIVVDSKTEAAPTWVFAVLTGEKGTYFLEGKRKPRPDIAKGNPLLEQAGFEIAGYASKVPVGEYSLSIATANLQFMHTCKTSIKLQIGDV